ncbi:hypothetical protein [Scytonema sp. UIC 10036]|uniref:hypothetical protein n=1 Tax=Scytonema sp. UIC 10036 TaxID=2304196 RepID=UPI001A9C01CF|nr:hypothetical protein [Scytonema sp. UIC 10036]
MNELPKELQQLADEMAEMQSRLQKLNEQSRENREASELFNQQQSDYYKQKEIRELELARQVRERQRSEELRQEQNLPQQLNYSDFETYGDYQKAQLAQSEAFYQQIRDGKVSIEDIVTANEEFLKTSYGIQQQKPQINAIYELMQLEDPDTVTRRLIEKEGI